LFRKWGLPIIAFFGLVIGVYMVHDGNKQPPIPPIPFAPPKPPYDSYIAASGLIEAASENVPIGVSSGQIVETVFVKAGDICKKGDSLFQLDTRVFRSQIMEAQAQVDTAKAQLHKLIESPRPEEVPPLQFQMLASQANWLSAKARLDLYQTVMNPDAISKDEYQNAFYSEKASFNIYKEAEANLNLKLAGSWIEDIMIASKTVEQAEASVQLAMSQMDQTLIRAPFDGQVLQVKIYPGSYAQAYFDAPYSNVESMVMFGQIDPLHIRVDVDEEDAWRFQSGAHATAFVRGNSKISFKLDFVRVEPFVIPKRSLTGDNAEQTDTRVLQAIYKFSKQSLPVYVGQMMDIYIEAPPNPL
jgi:HlyD family secretion protein